MKKTLLLAAAIIFSLSLFAQIQPGQVSDFEDGTTQGWSNGGSSPNPPTNIPTGGPNGTDDNFLEEISTGGGGAGSKLLIQNDNPEWTGDWLGADIDFISFNAKNPGSSDLFLRLGLEGGPNNTRIVSNSSIDIPAGSNSWDVHFLLAQGDFVVVSGPDLVEEVLQDVKEVRILSNPNVSYNGEAVMGTMHIDNILAEQDAGTQDFTSLNATVFPNPVKDVLNIEAQLRVMSSS